jgi:diguanylate cyclase (GGDEF)-like protein/PAS domain S-box-containing protein
VVLDVITLSVVLAVAGVIQAGILVLQYWNNPGYPGVGWWALGSIASAGGFSLIILRANPVWLTVAVIGGNTLFVASQILFYRGTQKFLGLRERAQVLYVAALLNFLVLVYYFFVDDQPLARTILISASAALLAAFNAFALFPGHCRNRRDPQLLSAGAFAGLALVFLARMFYWLSHQDSYGDYFSPTLSQLVMLFSVFAAGSLWTYGFILMVNQRLHRQTDEMRQRFEVLFHTNPDAAMLTRMDDGMIVEVNEGFSRLFGFRPAEVAGKTSLDLKLWRRREDRRSVVEQLLRKNSVENREFAFQTKAGYEWVGAYTAKIIYLHDVPYLISLIRDITLRKQEEEKLRQSEALHRSILAASPDGVLITDLSGTILMVSPKIVSIAGYEETELIGKNQLQFLVPDDRSRAMENIELMFQDIYTGPGEYRLLDAAGKILDVETNAEFVRDALGQPQKIVFIIRDIRERKQIEAIMQRNSSVRMILGKIAEEALRGEALVEFYAKVHLLVEKILPVDSVSIVLVDEVSGDVNIPYCSGEKTSLPAARKAGGGLTEHLIRLGKPLLLDMEGFRQLKETGEINLDYGNIDHQWLGAPLSDLHGKTFGIVALNLHNRKKAFQEQDAGLLAIIAAQISLAIGRKRLEDDLTRLAMTDELTGIANRRYFMQRLTEEIHRLQRYPAAAVLLMMDIDHFKTVNDSYGHAAGDEVLRVVTRTSLQILRETDLIGRIGGEEFCLFLPQTTQQEAMLVAERLRREIAGIALRSDKGENFSVTVSVGIAGVKPTGETLSGWLSRADKALYAAKAAGRNRSVVAGDDNSQG